MSNAELAPKQKQETEEKEHTRAGRHYVPDVDIYETPEELRVVADMPGVDQSFVHVELHDDMLTLRGEVALSEYDGLRPIRTEYNVGNFLRRFRLQDVSRFDADRIRARISDGVLVVHLPKAERAKPRRIEVNVAG